MKKLESTIVNMVVVLVCVAGVMSCILAYVNHITEGPIALQAEKTLQDGIKTVMGGGELKVTDTENVTLPDNTGKEYNFVIYQTQNTSGEYLGAAVESTTGGFGGNLRVLVGFNPEGDILGYTVLEHSETPGLGAKATTWFQEGAKGDIIGKNPGSCNLTVSKDGGDIDAITASTITSRAFLLAVSNAYNAYKKNPNIDAASSATKQEK